MPPLPPPLPPEERTVGQVIAEALRVYGRRFWVCLPLGLSVAVIDQTLRELPQLLALAILATAGGAVLSACYAAASAITADTRLTGGTLVAAVVAGTVVFAPVPFLSIAYVLPAIAWLALTGLCVPVAVIERLGPLAAIRRATRLARADYVHALGGLAAIAIVWFLARYALLFLLRDQGEQTERVAAFLADLVLSPLLFLGAAMLYFDQAARLVGSRTPQRARRRGDADLHPADDADRPGRSDAEVQP